MISGEKGWRFYASNYRADLREVYLRPIRQNALKANELVVFVITQEINFESCTRSQSSLMNILSRV